MTSATDPFRVLGLTAGASLNEIRSAYRRLAKQYHPDTAGERALPRFLAIQAAYERLVDGVVEDPSRVTYLSEHLDALRRSVADGVNVARYHAWSLLDNFEWEHGYDKRFGIVRVDYATQERILKRSALWYREHIAAARGGRV